MPRPSEEKMAQPKRDPYWFDNLVEHTLDILDETLDPEGEGGPRNRTDGRKHDRGLLLSIWGRGPFEEVARASLPVIQAVIERLEAADAAVEQVIEVAPDWGRYPSDLIDDRTLIIPHDDWRWHTQREAVTALLAELRGLRHEILCRCSFEFTTEWEKEQGGA